MSVEKDNQGDRQAKIQACEIEDLVKSFACCKAEKQDIGKVSVHICQPYLPEPAQISSKHHKRFSGPDGPQYEAGGSRTLCH